PLVIGIRGRLAALQADVVEAFLPPAPYAFQMAFSAATPLTQAFALEVVDDLAAAPEMRGALASAAAEAVETFLPQAPYAAQLAFPAAAAMLSTWIPEPIREASLTLEVCGAVQSPAAEVVEAFLPPAPY